jgi:hypothetical protein
MTTFLAHPLVKRSKLLPVYFSNVAVSEEDRVAVQELALYLENKKIRQQAPNNRNKAIDDQPKQTPVQSASGY